MFHKYSVKNSQVSKVSCFKSYRTIGLLWNNPDGRDTASPASDLYSVSYLFMQFLETITYSRYSWIYLNNFPARCKWCKFLHLKTVINHFSFFAVDKLWEVCCLSSFANSCFLQVSFGQLGLVTFYYLFNFTFMNRFGSNKLYSNLSHYLT